MKIVKATLESTAPYQMSAPIQSTRETGEGHDAFEERTWRERMHVTANGQVFIPPQAVKNCLAECAKYLGESVRGKGKATWTKHFEAGTMVVEPILLVDHANRAVMAKDVQPLRLFVPSDGKRGGTTRVWKKFPHILQWRGDVEVVVMDPQLLGSIEKVTEYLSHAGKFIGVGAFRPRNNGYFGRFRVLKSVVSEVS